jgi:hypothetical protein
MLPPVAEVYVVWHPDDRVGERIARDIVEHFQGTPFTGLIGGGVEVFVRSAGWRGAGDAPRPIPFPGRPLPNGLTESELVAVVPVLGPELASACEAGTGPWYEFVREIAAARETSPQRVGVFPVMLNHAEAPHTRVGRMLGRFQGVGSPEAPTTRSLVCRDLAQGLAQLADTGDSGRLTVFISHTKTETAPASGDQPELISQVRAAIRDTRLREIFDAHDLQPGEDWSDAISRNASTSAMLAVRTDGYASRSWCQREILTAKCAGMPVVILDALVHGDDRGSFLMDHVPRVPLRRHSDSGRAEGIDRSLHRLIDECLQRALWRRQRRLAEDRLDLEVSWWAPTAPEPATLADWLAADDRSTLSVLRILHPDPPLGPDEMMVLEQLVSLSGVKAPLEILTPRTLAARRS